MNAETRRVLQETRRYLIERGWRRDPWGKPGGPRCLIRAMGDILKDQDGAPGVAALQVIADELGLPLNGVMLGDWNDAQPSVEPVIALLDKVLAESGREPQTCATNGHEPRVSEPEADQLPSRPEPQVVA